MPPSSDSVLPVVLGQRVRKVRKAKGLSQERVAERAGLQAAVISRVEHGRLVPTLGTLAAIAKGLEVEMADLLGEEHRSVGEDVSDEERRLLERWRRLPAKARRSLLSLLADLTSAGES